MTFFRLLFGCRHPRISWPVNGRVQCPDCARTFRYDWELMKIAEEVTCSTSA